MLATMPAAKANVFNIPAAAPFLPELIDALLAGTLVPGFPKGRDPLELARATIYLPTRRAGRLARDVFLDRLGDAAILPRIVALGDLDEDEIAFADAASGTEALTLRPAFAPLERRLTLAQLISKWATATTPTQGAPLIANTPGAAIALADALARLMDDMITRQVPWKNLDRLVPEDLDKYWQESLNFLQFAHPQWNKILAEAKAIEAADRRDRLIAAEAQRLAKSEAPVIAAGSTGSMPATATLLATIATLPHGAVVLPGLDMSLDDASWALIAGDGKDKSDDDKHDGLPAAGHPQFAMHALLDRLRLKRAEVKQLGKTHGREALVSEALRPAATTDRWRERLANKEFDNAVAASLGTLTLIEAANAEEEALAIAAAMREALEEPKKTIALVTPDRALARRVKAALARWDVAVDALAATRWPTRRPACSRGSRRRSRLAALNRCRCWRCSSIRCCASASRRAGTIRRFRHWSAQYCAGRGRKAAAPASLTHWKLSAPTARKCTAPIRAISFAIASLILPPRLSRFSPPPWHHSKR
jgi:ATP-dependent helicase/nuclease subunit B